MGSHPASTSAPATPATIGGTGFDQCRRQTQAFRYGTMRQRVLGLEAVLPDGTVLSDLTCAAQGQ